MPRVDAHERGRHGGGDGRERDHGAAAHGSAPSARAASIAARWSRSTRGSASSAGGIWLVAEGSWGFDDFWIVFGLAVYAASFLTGALFLGPESGRIGKLVDEHGVEHPEAQRRIRRIFALSRSELLLLVAVVFDMTVKPSFQASPRWLRPVAPSPVG